MIRGIIFDINGTLSDIWTDEESLDVYRVVSNFLDYQGVKIQPEKLKNSISKSTSGKEPTATNRIPNSISSLCLKR